MIRVALPVLILSLGGCAGTAPAESAGAAPAEALCKAEAVQDLIGQTPGDALGKDALARSGARTLRWVPEGSAVTMDYRADRLNVQLDGQGRISKLSCG
jgi:hypothetical protein